MKLIARKQKLSQSLKTSLNRPSNEQPAGGRTTSCFAAKSTDGMVGHRRCVRKSVHKREDSDAASKMKIKIEATSQNQKTALSQHPQRAASRRLN
jgi:hypothetical protein